MESESIDCACTLVFVGIGPAKGLEEKDRRGEWLHCMFRKVGGLYSAK